MAIQLEKRMLVTVFLGEHDLYEGKPLYHAITLRLRAEHFKGISVTRGLEGFGPHSLRRKGHTEKLLNISVDPPIIIQVVETAERTPRLLEILDEMLVDGEVLVSEVQGISYSRSKEIR